MHPGPKGFNNMKPLAERKLIIVLGILIIFGLITGSCTSVSPTPEPTMTATPTSVIQEALTATLTPTARPSPTPTLPPLGSEGNPVKIGFILLPEQIDEIEAAEDIAFLIGRDTEYAVESLIYPDFQSLSTAIIDGDVDLFWLEPLQYLYLHQVGAAKVLLMTNRMGVYAYGIQFMANQARGFRTYFNPETQENIGDSLTALQQFAGTRPCFLNPQSLPGYFVPLGILANTSTPTLDPVLAYTYDAIIRALYIREICDFGVGYTHLGDPLTAANLIQDLPDAPEVIDVIWQTDAIIPNINLSTSPNLPLYMQLRLQEAFLDLKDNPEGFVLLTNALNVQVEALKEVGDGFYNPLREVIIPLELDLQAITVRN